MDAMGAGAVENVFESIEGHDCEARLEWDPNPIPRCT
jgi:hypothetical protein